MNIAMLVGFLWNLLRGTFNLGTRFAPAVMGMATVSFTVTDVAAAPPVHQALVSSAGSGTLRTETDPDGETVGCVFTVGVTNLTVTKLGVFDEGGNGLAQSHAVGLWDSSGTLLASVTVPSGTTGELLGTFRYTALVTTVRLHAGETYTMGAYFTNGSGDRFRDHSSSPVFNSAVTVSAAAPYGNARYNNSTAGLAYPSGYGGATSKAYLGANLQFLSEARKVLFIGAADVGEALAHWPLPSELSVNEGIDLTGIHIADITWEKLTQFHAVIVGDLSRYDSSRQSGGDHIYISPTRFNQIKGWLTDYVDQGGGLYIFGASFGHMGEKWAMETVNLLSKDVFDGELIFEEITDPTNHAVQPNGRGVTYMRVDQIAPHPVTANVSNWWIPVKQISAYGPFTRPLKVGPSWTPIMQSGTGYEAKTLDSHSYGYTGLTSAIAGQPRATLYAVRNYGNGRIVLNGSESTASFFNYKYNDWSMSQWGLIGMIDGLNQIPSDGYELLVSSLLWLTEPSWISGQFGGYVRPAPTPITPRYPSPITWTTHPAMGDIPYWKGIFGVKPSLDGTGPTVADFASTATSMGLSYIVCVADFATTSKTQWDTMVAACASSTTGTLLVVPALLTMDEQNNRFIQCGSVSDNNKSWPKSSRLSSDGIKVKDHWGYMADSGFPFRASYRMNLGNYPDWAYSNRPGFAIHTLENNLL